METIVNNKDRVMNFQVHLKPNIHSHLRKKRRSPAELKLNTQPLFYKDRYAHMLAHKQTDRRTQFNRKNLIQIPLIMVSAKKILQRKIK